MMAHGKFEPDETFIAAWPRISRYTPLEDVDGNRIPGWDKLPKPSFLNGRWTCPDLGCSTIRATRFALEYHYLAIHMRARWPCEHAESFNCDKMFSSIRAAKQHADEHIPKCRWVCQYNRCLSQMQGRKQSRVGALAHYKAHVRQGHFQEGECQPLKVRNNEGTNEHQLMGTTGLEFALRSQ